MRVSSVEDDSLTAKVRQDNQSLSPAKIDLISTIIKEIYNRVNNSDTNADIDKDDAVLKDLNPVRGMYSSVCLVVLARTLQGVTTRAAAREIAFAMPMVPIVCLDLLKVLVYTGDTFN